MRNTLAFALAVLGVPAAILLTGQAAHAANPDAATAAALLAVACGAVVGWVAGRVGMALRDLTSPVPAYRRGWFGAGGRR